MTYAKTEIPDIIRDINTNALVNTSVEALTSYKAKKKQALEFMEMKNKVNSIENDMLEIKNMLKTLIEKA